MMPKMQTKSKISLTKMEITTNSLPKLKAVMFTSTTLPTSNAKSWMTMMYLESSKID